MFPYTNYVPAFGPKQSVHPSIPGFVGEELLPPEGGVGLGLGRMFGAACRAVASREGGPCQT